MESKQLHPRLTPEEMDEMTRLAKQCEVNPTQLATSFIRAALRASKSYGQRLRLPIDFQIVDEPMGEYRKNEDPPKPTRKGK